MRPKPGGPDFRVVPIAEQVDHIKEEAEIGVRINGGGRDIRYRPGQH